MIGYVSKNNYCMAYTNTSSNASIMFKFVDINFCSIIHLIVYHSETVSKFVPKFAVT